MHRSGTIGQGTGRISAFTKSIKFAALLSLLAVALFANMELRVAGEFKVLPLHNADVRAKVGGIIEEIHVRETQATLNEILADDFADSRKDRAVAEKQLSEAVSKLKLLLAGSRPEEIEATEAEVTRLEGQSTYVAEQLRLTELKSPISGIVTTPKVEEKLGQQVNKGDLVVEVYDLSDVIAEISVPEKEIADVKVGYPVVLKARAFFDKDFEGRVVSVAPAVTKDETGVPQFEKTVRVMTLIENPSMLLKPDMTGMAKIYCGERRATDIWTRRLAQFIRVEFWSWW